MRQKFTDSLKFSYTFLMRENYDNLRVGEPPARPRQEVYFHFLLGIAKSPFQRGKKGRCV